MNVKLVQTTTRDDVRLDGGWQNVEQASSLHVDACCLVHGTGGNFYSSTLFDALGECLLARGCGVLRINTRGHDLMSNASTARGGRRLGAAYETVDDCRHDLAAWVDWLRKRGATRIGLIGHSLGAVKCLYALAHEPQVADVSVVAISPPRLSYTWFCESPEGPAFLENYRQAVRAVARGQPMALLDVTLPLPVVMTAAGYVEKYGPDERYNYLAFIRSVRCPVLLTLGALEAENNMAFRGAAEALAAVTPRAPRAPQLTQVTIPGGDHFYSAVRPALVACVEEWLALPLAS